MLKLQKISPQVFSYFVNLVNLIALNEIVVRANKIQPIDILIYNTVVLLKYLFKT